MSIPRDINMKNCFEQLNNYGISTHWQPLRNKIKDRCISFSRCSIWLIDSMYWSLLLTLTVYHGRPSDFSKILLCFTFSAYHQEICISVKNLLSFCNKFLTVIYFECQQWMILSAFQGYFSMLMCTQRHSAWFQVLLTATALWMTFHDFHHSFLYFFPFKSAVFTHVIMSSLDDITEIRLSFSLVDSFIYPCSIWLFIAACSAKSQFIQSSQLEILLRLINDVAIWNHMTVMWYLSYCNMLCGSDYLHAFA